MIEACLVISSNFTCRYTDLEGADSLVLIHLRYLADHGYPFARAKVWFENGEYVALVVRGRFYVLRRPLIVGEVSGPFLRWFMKGSYGKAFNLSRIRKRGEVSSFYGVNVEVLRKGEEVVFKFGGGGGSVGGEVRGSRGSRLTGAVSIGGRNLFASGVLLHVLASFDSTGMYTEISSDVPPLLGPAFRVEGKVSRTGDSTYYSGSILPYLWRYPYRFGVGVGYVNYPILLGNFGRVRDPTYDLLLMASGGGVGYRLSLRYGWFSAFLFKGIGSWRERVGGMDRFRKFPSRRSLSDNFAVLRVDAHIFRLGDLAFGPFGDALFEEGHSPLYAVGLSAKFSKRLSFFLSHDGYFGMAMSVEL